MDGKQLLPPDSPPHLRSPPHDNEDGPHPPPDPDTEPSPQTAPAPKSGGSLSRPTSDDPSSKPTSPKTAPAPKSGGSPSRPTSDGPSSKPTPSKVQVEDTNKVEEKYNANVLVFFHQMLYKAKILYVTKYEGTWRYYITYEGFDKTDIWDEWVGYDRILARNKSNVQLKARRETEAKQKKAKVFTPPEERNYPENNKDENGRWRDPVYAEKERIDKILGTAMPLSLYLRLLEDREVSLHVGKVARLPHPYPVVQIVRRYKSYLEEENKRPTQLVEKVLSRLIDDFDAKLRSKVLFETEFDALKQITANVDADCLPSQLYGIEHLLRWLAQLPKATFRGIIQERSTQILADFLAFLEEHQDVFFLPKIADNQK